MASFMGLSPSQHCSHKLTSRSVNSFNLQHTFPKYCIYYAPETPLHSGDTHKEPEEVPGPGCSLSRTEVSSVIDVRNGLQGVKYSRQQ